MNETWEWLIAAAGWLFLLGILLIAGSAVPALAARRPRLLLDGFYLTLVSLVLVLLAWGLPRLLG